MAGRSYAATWREGAGEIVAGRLTAADSHLELGGSSGEPCTSISADEIVAVRIGRSIDERVRGRPALVVERVTGPPVHVAPVLGVGLTQELAALVQRWVSARTTATPLRVVVAGGGIAGAEVLLALRHQAGERVSVTLLSPSPEVDYRPLRVLEPFDSGADRSFDLAELAADCAAALHLDGLAGVDVEARTVTTFRGERIDYDTLVVATGARAEHAVEGALTFWGGSATAALRGLLADLRAGDARRVAFVVPGGTAWSLPAYELALLTADYARRHRLPRVRVTLVTAERAPLAVFGEEASAAVASRLDDAGIDVLPRVLAARARPEVLEFASGASLAADRVVAIPRLVGPHVDGLPRDEHGFIPVDPYCHVGERQDVFAAGDATAFAIKQGGLAAQQADIVAAGIAARSGAAVHPEPYRPVLRGLLLTGGRPLYLRAEDGGAASQGDEEPIWWPPAKVVARHLAPYLANRSAQPATTA